MSLTLTAVPDAAAGTIRITIKRTENTPLLYRTDANGTRHVRTPAGQLPSTGLTDMFITDHEAAMAGPVTYGCGYATVVARFPEGTQPRFTRPLEPTKTAATPLVTGYDAANPSETTVHEIIGRPDPIIVEGVQRTRRGTLEVWSVDHAGHKAIKAVVAKGPVMLRQPDHAGMDLYFYALEVQASEDNGRWLTRIDYVEVLPPAGDFADTFTFAELKATGKTFAQLKAAGVTFADVREGKVA